MAQTSPLPPIAGDQPGQIFSPSPAPARLPIFILFLSKVVTLQYKRPVNSSVRMLCNAPVLRDRKVNQKGSAKATITMTTKFTSKGGHMTL